MHSSSETSPVVEPREWISKNDLEVLIEVIDRRIHKAIDLDQVVLLTAEHFNGRLQKIPLPDFVLPDLQDMNEELESIVSKCVESSEILREIRKMLKGLLDVKSSNK